MKKYLISFLLFINLNSSFSQTLTTNKIDSVALLHEQIMFDSQLLRIEEIKNEDLYVPIVLTLSVNRPAIGNQDTEFEFYWNNMNSESYKNYEDEGVRYEIDRQLLMINGKYNIAHSAFNEVTYLWDENKELIFVAVKYSSDISNNRYYYFRNNELQIYRQEMQYLDNEPETFDAIVINQNYLYDTFSNDVIAEATRYLNQSKELSKYFKMLFSIEGLRD